MSITYSDNVKIGGYMEHGKHKGEKMGKMAQDTKHMKEMEKHQKKMPAKHK